MSKQKNSFTLYSPCKHELARLGYSSKRICLFLRIGTKRACERTLAEVFPDHLHTDIAGRPFLPVELDRSQPLKVRQVLPEFLRRSHFLLLTRLDVPETFRDFASRPRSLADPHNLNIRFSRSQDPEDLLLRQPRLRQTETHSTSSLRRTNLRPVPSMPHEGVAHSSPSSQQ